MIDYDKLKADRSYRAGVADTLNQIKSTFQLDIASQSIDNVLDDIHQIKLNELNINQAKVNSLKDESDTMDGTPISC